MTTSADFEAAQARVKTLTSTPLPDELLELYALFKQGTQGDVTGSRPGMLDFKGRAKFDAWERKKGLSATPRRSHTSSSWRSSKCVTARRSAPVHPDDAGHGESRPRADSFEIVLNGSRPEAPIVVKGGERGAQVSLVALKQELDSGRPWELGAGSARAPAPPAGRAWSG